MCGPVRLEMMGVRYSSARVLCPHVAHGTDCLSTFVHSLSRLFHKLIGVGSTWPGT